MLVSVALLVKTAAEWIRIVFLSRVSSAERRR
jgi:hypothetical protein